MESIDTMHLNVVTKRDLRKSTQEQAEVEVIAEVVSFEMSMITNMKDWIVDSRLLGTFVATEVHSLPTPR